MLAKTTRTLLVAALLSIIMIPAIAKEAPKTTPAPTAKEGAKGKVVKLDASETKKLNTFFSNFSEAFLQPFEAGALTDDAMIEFAIMHNKINNTKLEPGGKLTSKDVDKACMKYFGVAPEGHHTVGEYEYADGAYTVMSSSGEEFTFSQLDSLTDNGDGPFNAKVNVYGASSGFTGDVHGTPASWKAADEEVTLSEKMTAVIKKVTEGGKSRYILLSLSKAE